MLRPIKRLVIVAGFVPIWAVLSSLCYALVVQLGRLALPALGLPPSDLSVWYVKSPFWFLLVAAVCVLVAVAIDAAGAPTWHRFAALPVLISMFFWFDVPVLEFELGVLPTRVFFIFAGWLIVVVASLLTSIPLGRIAVSRVARVPLRIRLTFVFATVAVVAVCMAIPNMVAAPPVAPGTYMGVTLLAPHIEGDVLVGRLPNESSSAMAPDFEVRSDRATRLIVDGREVGPRMFLMKYEASHLKTVDVKVVTTGLASSVELIE